MVYIRIYTHTHTRAPDTEVWIGRHRQGSIAVNSFWEAANPCLKEVQVQVPDLEIFSTNPRALC